MAQPPVAEGAGCTSERTAADAGCEPRGIGPARRNRGVSARGKSQDWPLVGLRSGKILKLRGWVRRCPRRQGYICLPLKLCRARAEDPCGEGGKPTIRLRHSKRSVHCTAEICIHLQQQVPDQMNSREGRAAERCRSPFAAEQCDHRGYTRRYSKVSPSTFGLFRVEPFPLTRPSLPLFPPFGTGREGGANEECKSTSGIRVQPNCRGGISPPLLDARGRLHCEHSHG